MGQSRTAVVVVHHGAGWTVSGRHAGGTDLPLTEHSRALARRLRPHLGGRTFARVLTSPLLLARQTCELAGLGRVATIGPDLVEWNYGRET